MLNLFILFVHAVLFRSSFSSSETCQFSNDSEKWLHLFTSICPLNVAITPPSRSAPFFANQFTASFPSMINFSSFTLPSARLPTHSCTRLNWCPTKHYHNLVSMPFLSILWGHTVDVLQTLLLSPSSIPHNCIHIFLLKRNSFKSEAINYLICFFRNTSVTSHCKGSPFPRQGFLLLFSLILVQHWLH